MEHSDYKSGIRTINLHDQSIHTLSVYENEIGQLKIDYEVE